MKFERRSREQSGQAVGALVGGLLVAFALPAAAWLHFGLPLPVCLFRESTGIPCPTCGSTRLIESLLSGRILEAATMNPLIFAALVAVLSWALLSTARVVLGLPVWRVVLGRWERRMLLFLAVVAALANWAYVIARSI
jgi:hypothetical protein